MSVEWFDLGMRLRASQTATVAARLAGTPVMRNPHPVALQTSHGPAGITVHAATPNAPEASAHGRDALDLLGDLGVTATAVTPSVLVTDSPGTLTALGTLASIRGTREDVAAHIGWWLNRADFPGGRAVVDVLSGCRARWVTGLTPKAERSAGVWREWLGVTTSGPTGLLGLYDALTEGTALRHLDTLAEDDLYAWHRAREDHEAGRDWRGPDTPARAALGLRSRCDAADLYSDALLSDPLWRQRAVHTGHVVVGTLTVLPNDRLKRANVHCQRLDARLRPGRSITGWAGTPGASAPVFTARIEQAEASAGTLVLGLAGLAGVVPASGSTVSLHEAGPNVWSQRRSRSTYAALYRRRQSWLSTGRAPGVSRRDVPLEVLVAGAEEEEL